MISGDDARWFLINASPDLGRQIEQTPELQPRFDPPRNSPIAGVLLTNADLDHALGLLLLRERQMPLDVYAADETKTALAWMDNVLARFCGINWRKISADFQSLSGSISFRAIELPGSVAFQFRDDASGATVLFAPTVGELTEELRNAVRASDVVMFDGTFWSDDELAAIRPGARRAREMNHLPISDRPPRCCIRRQSAQCAPEDLYPHKQYEPDSDAWPTRERAQVEQAGIEIARDGLEERQRV